MAEKRKRSLWEKFVSAFGWLWGITIFLSAAWYLLSGSFLSAGLTILAGIVVFPPAYWKLWPANLHLRVWQRLVFALLLAGAAGFFSPAVHQATINQNLNNAAVPSQPTASPTPFVYTRAYCESLSPTQSPPCFTSLAVQNKNVSICLELAWNFNLRCADATTRVLSTPPAPSVQLCTLLNDAEHVSYSIDCWTTLAKQTHDPSYCNRILLGDYRNACTQAVQNAKNASS